MASAHTHTRTRFCQELWNQWCWKRVPVISSWDFHLLLSGPKQPLSCVQFSQVPLGALCDHAFWEWQEQCISCLAFEGSSSAPAGKAVPGLGGTCLARHRWLPRQSACLVSTGSLSVSKPAFMSQVCHSAAPGVNLAGSELFCSLCTASAAALSKGVQRNCWAGVGAQARRQGAPSSAHLPFQGPPELQALKEEGLGCLNFPESQNHLSWKGPLRSSNPAYDWTPP